MLWAAKIKVKSKKKITTTTLYRQMIVQYENIYKCSESKFKIYIFNIFKSKQAILNSMLLRVICPFSDMTLHFLDLTTTGN